MRRKKDLDNGPLPWEDSDGREGVHEVDNVTISWDAGDYTYVLLAQRGGTLRWYHTPDEAVDGQQWLVPPQSRPIQEVGLEDGRRGDRRQGSLFEEEAAELEEESWPDSPQASQDEADQDGRLGGEDPPLHTHEETLCDDDDAPSSLGSQPLAPPSRETRTGAAAASSKTSPATAHSLLRPSPWSQTSLSRAVKWTRSRRR